MHLTKDQKFLKKTVSVGKKIQEISSYLSMADQAKTPPEKAILSRKAEAKAIEVKKKFKSIGNFILDIKKETESIKQYLEKKERQEKLEELKEKKEERRKKRERRKEERRAKREKRKREKQLRKQMLRQQKKQQQIFQSEHQETELSR